MNFLRYFHRSEDVLPYAQLAAVYDRVMDHVDYDEWASYIEVLFQKYGSNVRNVVDGACGTGSLTLSLKKRGYCVVGFDRSFEMIRAARKKVQVPIWQGDLRKLSLSKKWDAFICIYDSIQYLMVEEIDHMLAEVKAVLKHGGLLLFDVVTERHILHNWVNYTERIRDKSWDIVRRSWYDRKSRYQHTEFEVFSFREKKLYREHHLQKVYPLKELEEAVKKSGFTLLGKLCGFTLNPGSENSDRVHFILRQEIA